MMRARFPLVAGLLALVALPSGAARGTTAESRVVVGSKAFPESWVLAEALALATRSEGVSRVEHRNNLGGTEIVFQALRSGDVDVYPEYTGTILEVVLHSPRRLDLQEMRRELSKQGLGVSDPLGFNDSYAIAVTREARARYGLRTISDLARHPDVRLGLTHEFLGRPDGWPGLTRHYGLQMPHVLGIQHELAYTALASGRIDATDIYTTDAQIERLGLTVLEDDRGFFPRYDAVWLYRLDLAAREPRALRAMKLLTGTIDESRMIRANARVVLQGRSFGEAADSLLAEATARAPARHGAGVSVWGSILRNTVQHVKLVALSLLLAVLVGVPMGVIATRSAFLGNTILSLSGLLQTIPSLALLAVLIPIFGIGVIPALLALFLYSLLPIVRNTYVGLTTIPSPLAEAADAIGLSGTAKLFRVRLPMASPAIMAGIKTSAVINVGTATLAALIGAGGLGDPIITGLTVSDTNLVLSGALPAALLALVVDAGLGAVERLATPRGLRV